MPHSQFFLEGLVSLMKNESSAVGYFGMLPFLSLSLSLSLHLVDVSVSQRKLTLRITGMEHYCHAYRSILRMKFRNFRLHLTSRSGDEDYIGSSDTSLPATFAR